MNDWVVGKWMWPRAVLRPTMPAVRGVGMDLCECGHACRDFVGLCCDCSPFSGPSGPIVHVPCDICLARGRAS